MGIYADRQVIKEKANQAFIQALNETYFGRTPGITRCYNAFCDFRQKYTSESFIRGIRHIDCDHDKDLLNFCREMERQFGFESFSFIIENSLTQNMYTIPIVFWEGMKTNGHPQDKNINQYMYMDKEGYHFKKEIGASCMVFAYPQMLFDAKYSDDEMFSIVMHEVGHNFQAFINGDMVNMALVRSIIYVIELGLDIILRLYYGDIQGIAHDIRTLFLTNLSTHKLLSKLYNKITSNTTRNNLYSYFNFLRGLIGVPVSIANAVLMVPLAPVMGIISAVSSILQNASLIGIFMHSYNYLGEQMADNFPTYYGFGKSTVCQELKAPSPFGPLVEGLGKIPVVGHIYNFLLIPADILLSISDVHPRDITRCKSVLNSMKTDLNDPRLSPKLRAQLKKEIAESEKEVEEYLKRANNISDPEAIKISVDNTIFHSLNGGPKYGIYRSIFNLDKTTQDYSYNKLRESANYISDTKII